jgi:hypothetical protein
LFVQAGAKRAVVREFVTFVPHTYQFLGLKLSILKLLYSYLKRKNYLDTG